MQTGEARFEVKNVPEMHVAYLRHVGPYAGDTALFGRLFGQLFSWAGPRGLMGLDTKVMSIYQDDPDSTEAERLQVDAAITVPVGTPTDGEIGTRTIPAGTYAVGHFEILPQEYSEAWQTMMGRWLPESGRQSGDGPCLEIYLNEAGDNPESTHIVELYAPVRPL
ncbi:MAG: GyrI-like domain-containing protein [Actinobacteria bacterium]|nr:GyrI-like domain-containing protein [Actinomycetota bacterium]